jgi:hypothetical protein
VSFPKIHTFVLPVIIYAHSEEDAAKVSAAIQKMYMDHGIQPGTTGATGIEFKPLQAKEAK